MSGYRLYNTGMGRWLSRDPISERGGKNLYGFVGNSSVDIVDYIGEKWEKVKNSDVSVDTRNSYCAYSNPIDKLPGQQVLCQFKYSDWEESESRPWYFGVSAWVDISIDSEKVVKDWTWSRWRSDFVHYRYYRELRRGVTQERTRDVTDKVRCLWSCGACGDIAVSSSGVKYKEYERQTTVRVDTEWKEEPYPF